MDYLGKRGREEFYRHFVYKNRKVGIFFLLTIHLIDCHTYNCFLHYKSTLKNHRMAIPTLPLWNKGCTIVVLNYLDRRVEQRREFGKLAGWLAAGAAALAGRSPPNSPKSKRKSGRWLVKVIILGDVRCEEKKNIVQSIDIPWINDPKCVKRRRRNTRNPKKVFDDDAATHEQLYVCDYFTINCEPCTLLNFPFSIKRNHIPPDTIGTILMTKILVLQIFFLLILSKSS